MVEIFDPETWIADAEKAGMTVLLEVEADGTERVCFGVEDYKIPEGESDIDRWWNLRPDKEQGERNERALADWLREHGPVYRSRRPRAAS